MTHTQVRDMVSIARQEDLDFSGLEQKEPMWLCKLDDEEASNAIVLYDYIPEPFPKNTLEPLGWHDVLAMEDVCGNVHATRHCDKNGHDIMSCNMVIIVRASKGEEADSSQYNEETILEGSNKDYFQISSTTTPLIVPLRPVKMDITSIEDVVVDSHSEVEKEEMNGREDEFYDVFDEFPLDEKHRIKKPS